MTREEHLVECKRRALDYLDRGDIQNGVTSMLSDLDKHPETALRGDTVLTMLGMRCIIAHDLAGARRFVEGFR